jgi:hypothetical protein
LGSETTRQANENFIVNHISEELLEGYAMNVLYPVSRENGWEIHLRSVCRDRLKAEGQFAEAMNGAAAKSQVHQRCPNSPGPSHRIERHLPLPVGYPYPWNTEAEPHFGQRQT